MKLSIATEEGGQSQAIPGTINFTPAPPAPPIPILYPNIANPTDAKGSEKVLINGSGALRVADSICTSNGDQVGNAPGNLVSSACMGKAEGSQSLQSSVKLEGKLALVKGSVVDHAKHSPAGAKGLLAMVKQSKAWTRIFPPPSKPGGLKPVQDLESILNCSPMLQAQVDRFLAEGGQIDYTPMENGSVYIPSENRIQIWHKLANDRKGLASSLAHELGHAFDTQVGEAKITQPGMHQDDFMAYNLSKLRRSEGKAVLNQLEVRDEILNSPDGECSKIDIMEGDKNLEHFEEVYKKKGEMTRHDLIDKLATQYGERIHTDNPQEITTTWNYAIKLGRWWFDYGPGAR